MNMYKLTIINEAKGLNNTIDIPEDMFILNAAYEAQISLPFLCRTGDCSSCVCKVVTGTVIQGDQTGLTSHEVASGYFLACSARATSDVVIESHKEKELARQRKGI